MKNAIILICMVLNHMFGFNCFYNNNQETVNKFSTKDDDIILDEIVFQRELLTYTYEEIFEMSRNKILQQNKRNINHYSYDSQYLSTYFERLNHNMPINQMGSCGYVALGMILSYYDSFWNDETIYYEGFDYEIGVDNFNEFLNGDYSSPGVHFKYIDITTILNPSIGNMETNENQIYVKNYTYYHNSVYSSADNFHSYLLSSYGEPSGFINLYSESAFSLSEEELYSLCDDYINYEYLTNVYNLVYFDNESYSQQELRNKIITYINFGYPVLVGAKFDYYKSGNSSQSEIEKHAFVAYQYDISTDTIYGHNGYYGYGNTHVDIENMTTFDRISGAISYYFDLMEYLSIYVLMPVQGSHVCSNNYLIDGVAYCPCEFYNME